MKSTETTMQEINRMTEKLLESNRKLLDAAMWSARSSNVRRITVDGHEAVLLS